jgi:hypothetical protein
MPKRNIKSKKSKKSKKSRKYFKKNKTTKRKHQKHSARKGSRKFSKRVKGGDLPPNQGPQRPNQDDEMFIEREGQNNEDEDIGQQVNQLITRILDLGLVEQNTRPEIVYNVMTRIITLWNYVFDLYREGHLTEENLDHLRVIIDTIYDRLVRVTSQDTPFIHGDGEEPLPEIINIRSSAILSDLFNYVANITSNDPQTRINDIIVVGDYETTYGQIPDEDNPDFDTDDGSTVNEMDVSQ